MKKAEDKQGGQGTLELGDMDFKAGTQNNFKGDGRNVHAHKINAESGSNTNFKLVNLKVLDLQSLQFVDQPFALDLQNLGSPFVDRPFNYHAQDPRRQLNYNPNDPRAFVSLPGYCSGQGCQLMNLNQGALYLN